MYRLNPSIPHIRFEEFPVLSFWVFVESKMLCLMGSIRQDLTGLKRFYPGYNLISTGVRKKILAGIRSSGCKLEVYFGQALLKVAKNFLRLEMPFSMFWRDTQEAKKVLRWGAAIIMRRCCLLNRRSPKVSFITLDNLPVLTEPLQ